MILKRLIVVLLAVFMLTGCGNDSIDAALELRQQLLAGNGCRFHATVTADYGDYLYEFGMQCQTDELGNLSFSVTAPESISGITGNIRAGEGELTFDNQVLAFSLLADDQVTPVSAPWILIHTLRSGYINACSTGNGKTMLVIDDSYEEDALQLNIWLDEENLPTEAEILWAGRRILSLLVNDFTFM